MNLDQLKAILAIVLPVIGTWLTARGVVTADQWGQLQANIINGAAAVVTAAIALWGLWTLVRSFRPVAKIRAAASLPQVQKVVTDRTTAIDANHPDVVAAPKS